MGLSEAAGRLRLDCVMDSSVAVVTVTGEIDFPRARCCASTSYG